MAYIFSLFRNLMVILIFIILLFTETKTYAAHQEHTYVINENNIQIAADSLEINKKIKPLSDSALLRLTTKADTLFARKLYKQAAHLYKNLAKEFELNGNTLECAERWRQTATAYTEIPMHDSAKFCINKAIETAKSIKTGKEKAALQKCYNLAGKLYSNERNFKVSFEYYSAGLSLIKELSGIDNLEYSLTLDNLANIYIKTGKADSAFTLWTTSLAIKNKNLKNDDPEIGKSYYVIASQFYFKDKFDSSLFYLFKALEHTSKANLSQRANLYSKIGLIYQITAKYKQATEYLEKAVEANISCYGPFHLKVSDSYDLLATNYLALGYQEKASLCFNKAVEIERNICEPHNYSCNNPSLYNHIQSMYFEMGDLHKALEYARMSLILGIKKHGVASPELKGYYFTLGNTLFALQQNDSALFYYNKALAITNASDNLTDVIYQKISLLYASLDNMGKAYDNLEQAIKVAKKVYGETNMHVTYLYLTYAEYLVKDRQPEKAYRYLTLADSIRQLFTGPGYIPSYNINIAYAEIQYISGNYVKSEQYYLQAILGLKKELYNALRINEPFRKITKVNAAVYASLFKIKYHLNNNDKALSWLDKTKSNELIARTYEKVFLENFVDSSMHNSLCNLTDSIKYYSQKIDFAQENKNLFTLPLLSANLNKFNKEYNYLKDRIAVKYPEYNEIMMSSDSVQKIDTKTIGKQEAMVYYYVDRDSLWISIAGNDSIIILSAPCNKYIDNNIYNYNNLMFALVSNEDIFQVSLDNRIQYFSKSQLRKLLGNVNYSKYILQNPVNLGKQQIQFICDSLSTAFYQLLISPVEKYIAAYKNIVIVPDNILSFMPFSSLYRKDKEEKHFLVEDHNIRFAQSARLYGITQKRANDYSQLNRNDLFALAIDNFSKYSDSTDSVQINNYLAGNGQKLDHSQIEYLIKRSDSFDGSFSDLPFTTKEVDNIAGVFNKHNSTVIKNDKAVEKYIWQLNNTHELEKYKILHFATHAVYNNKKIDNTCMVLFDHDSTGPGKNTENDGYLNIPEIMRLKLKADLVVLSACETAQGEVIPGEGIYGMPYAFLLAGANNVLSSLWPVNDKTTEAFFTEFYNRIQHGETYTEALNNIYRLFVMKQKGQLKEIKVYSNEMIDVLNNPEYLNPSYWAAYVLW
jgi:CHAT domain-containing protein/tetratricopeptide (TPR) repeat protein